MRERERGGENSYCTTLPRDAGLEPGSALEERLLLGHGVQLLFEESDGPAGRLSPRPSRLLLVHNLQAVTQIEPSINPKMPIAQETYVWVPVPNCLKNFMQIFFSFLKLFLLLFYLSLNQHEKLRSEKL